MKEFTNEERKKKQTKPKKKNERKLWNVWTCLYERFFRCSNRTFFFFYFTIVE